MIDNRRCLRRKSDLEAQKWRERFISAMLALSFTLTVVIIGNSFDCKNLKARVLDSCYKAATSVGN